MTVRRKCATMTSSTGREADDTLGHGENGAKRAKGSGWSCCDGGEITVVASTDIPSSVRAGPYPGGLDFAVRTSDHQAVTNVVKVGWREDRLVADNHDHTFPTTHHRCKLQLVGDRSLKWMMALQPARDRHEQNVEVLAEGGRLVLRVLKAIPCGQRLLLWYSESLARAFGVPFLTPAHIRGNQQYTCTSCHASFQYPNTLKAHILFKCDAATIRTPSPSLTSPSAFSAALPLSSFRCIDSGPSAFHRSIISSKSPSIGSVSRTRDSPSMTFTRRRDWDHSTVSPHRKSESSGRSSLSDRRAMTPDSSTDDSSALNLSTRKSMCTSAVPALSIPVCHNVQHSPPGNPSMTGSIPATGQPIQIFNHIHPPGLPTLPLPLDQHMALRLYYPWLATMPGPNSTKLFCTPVPAPPSMLDTRHHFNCQSQNRSFIYPHLFSSEPDPQSLLMTATAKHPLAGRGGMMPASVLAVSQQPLSGTTTHSMSNSTTASSPSSSSSSKAGVPLLPVPSEKEREPLDLLPPSFFASKSRKGHLCLYCGKLYSRKYGLKIHLRTHTGYKPLKCKVCLRPFGDPSNLNKHVRLHAEGDTPYRCDYCGKVLVRRRDLERHIRSRHPSVTEMKEEDDISTECIDSEVDVTSDTESTVDGGEQEIEVT